MTEAVQTSERARMPDGSWVSVQDARIVARQIYASIVMDSAHALGLLLQIGRHIEDIDGLLGSSQPVSSDAFGRQINNLLASEIFSVPRGMDSDWRVSRETALTVVRNMVVVDLKGDGEIYLQEPLENRPILYEAWQVSQIRPKPM